MEMPTFSGIGATLQQVGQYVQDKITGHNPIPDMPLEFELLIAAWDNLKKNYLDTEIEDMILDGTPGISATTEEICEKMDQLMQELVREFQKQTR